LRLTNAPTISVMRAMHLDRYQVESALVQRFAGGMPQPLYFVLNHQFPALQFENLQVVR
jgi:hypothetical protein